MERPRWTSGTLGPSRRPAAGRPLAPDRRRRTSARRFRSVPEIGGGADRVPGGGVERRRGRRALGPRARSRIPGESLRWVLGRFDDPRRTKPRGRSTGGPGPLRKPPRTRQLLRPAVRSHRQRGESWACPRRRRAISAHRTAQILLPPIRAPCPRREIRP